MAKSGLEIGYLLDAQWHLLRAEMEETKRPALVTLAQVPARAGTPYAIIGGVALQVHQAEPRTTLDIDLAVPSFELLPREQLQQAGFAFSGRYSHSEHWTGPVSVPVPLTDDLARNDAVERAEQLNLDGVPLRVIGRLDLLHEKLRAGSDPARRRSKRLQDLVDAQVLLDETPELREQLTPAELATLDVLPQ